MSMYGVAIEFHFIRQPHDTAPLAYIWKVIYVYGGLHFQAWRQASQAAVYIIPIISLNFQWNFEMSYFIEIDIDTAKLWDHIHRPIKWLDSPASLPIPHLAMLMSTNPHICTCHLIISSPRYHFIKPPYHNPATQRRSYSLQSTSTQWKLPAYKVQNTKHKVCMYKKMLI